MRSYTNKKGESIEVSEQHLDTAIRIKQELQKASPSRRCSWVQHKKLMEQEGFFDSENNENYRKMVMKYQKEKGELPEAPKYADMVADGKLESIKELVGEIAYEKREAQHEFKKLNKVKRDIIDFTLIAEQIGRAFANHDFSKLRFDSTPIENKTGKKMFVALSDIHIGALVDNEINKYNYEIAQQRMQVYLKKVIYEAKRNNVTDVYVMNLGDVIEHPYMHNLSYTSEFTLQEQIVLASDIIIKFLIGLAEAKLNVTTAGIAGNHDRLNDDKKKNLDGDHAVKGVNYAIKSFIENAKAERIKYEQAGDYGHTIELNGKYIKCVHGDLDPINDKSLLAKHTDLDGVNYSILVMGHYHHHWIKEHGLEKYMVGFGSLKGADGHGVKAKLVSSPSQGIIIIDEDGEIEIKRIKVS
jgi:predicted phosphodiesterase